MGRSTKELRKLQVTDGQGKISPRAVKESLDESINAVNNILRNPLSEAVLIEGVTLDKDSFTDVRHGLGREPRGWLQVKANALVTVLEVEKDDTSRFIRLEGSFHHPSTTAKVSLLVF